MPKGDWKRLKADPEDGYAPVASLLLEALAMAKLSGEEKGAILYLWRKTYGWKDGSQRRREAQIGKMEWAAALNTNPRRALRVLSNLVNDNVFLRRDLGSGLGYVYSMNTRLAKWKCLPIQQFMNQVQLLYGAINIPLMVPVSENGNVAELPVGVAENDHGGRNRPPSVVETDHPPVVETDHPPVVETDHPLTLLQKDIHKKNIKNTENTNGGKSQGFFPLLKQLHSAENEIYFLTNTFRQLHPGATPEDLNGNLFNRIGQMFSLVGGEQLLRLIWKSSAAEISGSHLDYLQGAVNDIAGVKRLPGKKRRQDPGGYQKGKYSHIVLNELSKTYRIRNTLTNEWWEGLANYPEHACARACWPIDQCEIEEKTEKGGWSLCHLTEEQYEKRNENTQVHGS